MKNSVSPSTVRGTLPAPGSKSYAQRALAAALLSPETSTIHNITWCDDACASRRVAEALGAKIEVDGRKTRVHGGIAPRANQLDCGEAGLCIRMFTPIAALASEPLTMIAHNSLCKRPVHMLEPPLRALGAQIATNDGFPPIQVCGPLRGGNAEVDGSISSQMITGMLLALPCAQQDSILHVHNPTSIPYLDMTLEVLGDFGIEITHQDHREFQIPGKQTYRGTTYSVEGDWSGASCLLVAGAIAGSLSLTGLDRHSAQADYAIINALEAAGAKIAFTPDTCTIHRDKLRAFDFDATECPDLFPALVALAAHCSGESHFHGASRLTHKESNRALALQQEFAKLGITILCNDDLMTVVGGEVHGGEVFSHDDHRIAMCAAVAALGATDSVVIEGAECVSKSYPDFFADLDSLLG